MSSSTLTSGVDRRGSLPTLFERATLNENPMRVEIPSPTLSLDFNTLEQGNLNQQRDNLQKMLSWSQSSSSSPLLSPVDRQAYSGYVGSLRQMPEVYTMGTNNRVLSSGVSPPTTSPCSPRTSHTGSPSVPSPLSPHRKSSLNQRKSTEEKTSFPCLWGECQEVFCSSEELIAHCNDCHIGKGISVYSCEWRTCSRKGFRFSKKSKLANHFRCHSGEKPHMCPLPGCGKSFPRTDSLRTHIETHSGFRKFTCPVEGCGRKYYHQRSLKKHLKDHPQLSEKDREMAIVNAIKDFNDLKECAPGEHFVTRAGAEEAAKKISSDEQKRRLNSIIARDEETGKERKRNARQSRSLSIKYQRRKSDATVPYKRPSNGRNSNASVASVPEDSTRRLVKHSTAPVCYNPNFVSVDPTDIVGSTLLGNNFLMSQRIQNSVASESTVQVPNFYHNAIPNPNSTMNKAHSSNLGIDLPFGIVIDDSIKGDINLSDFGIKPNVNERVPNADWVSFLDEDLPLSYNSFQKKAPLQQT